MEKLTSDLELNFLDKVCKDKIIKRPRTPSIWLGEPLYHDVAQIRMAKGENVILILGNDETLKSIQEKANSNEPIVTVNTFDNRTVYLNTSFIISAEVLTIVEQRLHSDNNFFATGDYVCRYLLPKGQTVTFSNAL